MSETDSSYCIKHSYQPNPSPVPSQTTLDNPQPIVQLPHLYPFAAHLARLYGADTFIMIGCARAHQLAEYQAEFKLIGLDTGQNLDYCQSHYPDGQWINVDLDTDAPFPLDPAVLPKSIVICSDVLESRQHPEALLRNLKRLLDHVPVVLLATPDRDLWWGYDHNGPPPDTTHVREWNKWELSNLLQDFELSAEFLGYTCTDNLDFAKTTLLAVLANNQRPPLVTAPDDFRALAIIHAYNEADVIEATIQHLIADGIDVHVVDNWSIDGTREIASQYLGRGVVQVELFPPEGSTGLRQLKEQMARTEEIVASSNYNWYIHHDADEYHQSPWADYRLIDALYHVDQCGFNAINFFILNFSPVDQTPLSPDEDYSTQMNYFAFGEHPAYTSLIRAWKNMGQTVDLKWINGHAAAFENRRIFPYKFLMRHYPIRSQDHGVRKVLRERFPRFALESDPRNKGNHYNHIQAGYDFTYNRLDLYFYEPIRFAQEFLVERLSSVGIVFRDMAKLGSGKDHFTQHQRTQAHQQFAETQRQIEEAQHQRDEALRQRDEAQQQYREAYDLLLVYDQELNRVRQYLQTLVEAPKPKSWRQRLFPNRPGQ